MLVITPPIPVTRLYDGYGVAGPESGTETAKAVPLVNDAVPGGAGFTVRTKFVLTSWGPSLTVTVITAVPICVGDGVTVKVRLLPLPPNTIFASCNSAGFEEDALNCNTSGTVSS